MPAILEDSNLDVSCLPFYKDVIFLMVTTHLKFTGISNDINKMNVIVLDGKL